jgi:ribosome-associated protein
LRCKLEPLEKAHQIVNFLEEKIAENILLLDIHELTTFTDFFIICSGTSGRMLDAIGSQLRDYLKQEFGLFINLEGDSSAGWVLLDAEDVIIHIFSPQQRNYYKLEELWQKGKTLVHLQ